MIVRRRWFSICALLVLVLTLGTASTTNAAADSSAFPASFAFGTAIAGFQNDMGCPELPARLCDDPNSDWYVWTQTPPADLAGYITGGPVSTGPGFRQLHPQDLHRAADGLSSNSIRLSIEWSRIFPTPTFGVEGNDNLRKIASPVGLAYYHALLGAIRDDGLRPLVTINHYTLPTWMHDPLACHASVDTCEPSGWLDPQIVTEIAKYAGFVAAEFGGQVDQWITLNEPVATAVTGYAFPPPNRVAPPGVRGRLDLAQKALGNMILANAAMYDAVKANDGSAQVGVVLDVEPTLPSNPASPYDQAAAASYEYLSTILALNAFTKGLLDPNLTGHPVLDPALEHKSDFLGINYYKTYTVSFSPGSPLGFNPNAVTADYDRAQGIYEALKIAAAYGLPMLITETGRTVDQPDTASRWIVQTLEWVQRAIEDSAPVEGYYYWTLTDNYDWTAGMGIRMGLYGVTPSKARYPRPAAAVFKQIASSGTIPESLRTLYPIT